MSGSSLTRRLLHTESEWNPKVMLGRVLLRVVPEKAMHRFKKHYYYRLLKRRRESEMEHDVAICDRLIQPWDTVLDIGANHGSFCRFMAKRAAKVYAFEPIEQTYDFLTHNMRKLKLANVECLKFALSDRDQDQTMVIPTYRWGQECWYDARIKTANANPAWREFTIASRTLDSLALPQISFIKCDANYHELAVLRGALETIRRDHPAMLIEVNPNPDNISSTAHQTFELLRGEGYQVYWYDGKALRLRKAGERSQNYFFLRPEHMWLLESKAAAAAA